MPAFRRKLTAVAALTILSGCATQPAQIQTGDADAQAQARFSALLSEAPPQPLQTASERAQFHVLLGEMAAGRHQPKVAATEFLAALGYVDDVDLARRATGLALAARDTDTALAAATRWQQLDPNNADPRQVIAGIALSKGDRRAALEQCAALVEGDAGGKDEGFRDVAQILAQTGSAHADDALAVMSELAGRYPENAAAQHALGTLALRFNKLGLAASSAENAMKLEPDAKSHAILLAAVRLHAGRIDEADALIDKIAAGDPDEVDLRMGYTKLLLEREAHAAARRQLKKVLTLDRNQPDALYALGLLEVGARELDAARGHFKRLLNGPRSQEAAMELGRIEEVGKHYPQALDYYSRVSHGAMAVDARLRQAFVLAQMDKLDDARKLLAELRDDYPQMSMRFYLAEGEILVGQDRYEDALSLYDDALARNPGTADLLYGRSLVYERMDKLDAAEADLRSIIADDPDDARALNALGYMLLEHSTRYDDAQPLIEKAIKLEPDDAAIIDSMGWLQYKRGNLDEAVALLRKAYARFPDPEVAAHLGEVLWVQGQHEQARDIWNTALKQSPEHPVITRTMQRLTQ